MKSLVKYVDTKHAFFFILILYEPTPPTKVIECYHNYPKYLIK